ncbi:hypothetical protein [Nocardia abscessus]|uniref:hypothetical protein n=1 Tax=Nocardia abscessus TaxID=120957 RepID=UPI0002EEB2D2|nr:hypothetical protein [Nocardia abscessus]MCC3333536.1 hypothetical protein [Nocardia abscessus]
MTLLNELLARAWELVTIGVLLGVGICAVAGLPSEFSGAPAEPEDEPEEFDDTAAWDRGHDQWVDEQTGVSW